MENILYFSIFLLSINHSSFHIVELSIILISLYLTISQLPDLVFLLLYRKNNFKRFFKIKFIAVGINFILKNINIIGMLLLTELLLLRVNDNKFTVNLRRKIFHLSAFFIFLNITTNEMKLLLGLLENFLFLSEIKYTKYIFRKFLSDKDFGKIIYSHIFLAGGCILPYFHLNRYDYTKVLISLCIMDSFCSIIPLLFYKISIKIALTNKKTILKPNQSNKKTILGFVSGQLASYITEYMIFNKVSLSYHLVMGIMEYKISLNDNITLPFLGTLYLKANKK
ncbi:hypothetical protein HERIO_1607 [Hepatospora eriocheir]|uniref:Dolichol kinase n=1 Tax=Hepatospora eriocheir TaxID=1081669 RepID=A0A1X0Q9N0_9MICR|nr:hypothetical protein HERIO_1607 [Hepatospora eriocheir]